MSPDNPQTPSTGQADDDAGKTPDAAEKSKEQASKEKAASKADATGKGAKSEGDAPKKTPAASKKKEPAAKAKDAAAEETGVDKAAAKAGAEAEDAPKKPKRKTSTSKAEEKAADPKPRTTRGRKRAQAEPGIVVRAHAKYVRSSARKARLVCDHIRGKDVQQARAILAFTPRAVAKDWAKLLESAVANAEHNHELVGEELRIANVFADEGPTLKRFRPRAMGRATRIRKRTSHLTITLTPKES